jgi:MFS family permease
VGVRAARRQYLITAIDLTIVNVSLPTIGRDLHFSSTSLQWVLGVIALLAPPAVFALMRGDGQGAPRPPQRTPRRAALAPAPIER